MTITGKCHCGAISYSVDAAPEHHAMCHCDDCRVWGGSPMVGWIAFKESGVTISGSPKTYHSSPGVTREFCGDCGTGLFYRNPAMIPGIVDVHSATLDDPAAHPPEAQIMVKHRLPWTAGMTDLPAFEGFPDAG